MIDPPRRGAALVQLALSLALACAAVAPVFEDPQAFAHTYDWRYFQTWVEIGRRTVVWFHQLPLWNPWTCGGQVQLANPQSLVTAPSFLLPLLFGTALGLKLTLVAYFFFAIDGMWRLGRALELSATGARLASVLFGTGGWLALHLSEGHVTFAGAALFPYMILCYRRALDARRWALPLGALAAWVVALGGTSTPPMAIMLLGTLGAIDSVRRRSAGPFAVLALGGVVAALLGAVRVLPALQFALDHPRHLFETDRNTIWQMIRNGYWWKGVEPVAGKRYWFHEYGWRLPYLTPPLILWSLSVRRSRWLWLVVAMGAGIVAGDALPYGPWWWMRQVPVFRDLRVPSRYSIFFALALPLLCGAALDDLSERLRASGRARAAGRLALAVLIVCTLDGLAFDWVRFRGLFDSPVELAGPETAFQQVRGNWRTMMNHVLANRGAIGCDEEAPLQRAKVLEEGQVAQARLLDPAAGELRAIRWTPNRVEVEVALTRPTTVLFNQNWNEHWRSDEGAVIKHGPKWEHDDRGGRLALELGAGTRTAAVYYRPRSFVVGAALSAISLPLALLLWLLAGRRRS